MIIIIDVHLPTVAGEHQTAIDVFKTRFLLYR